MDYKRDLPKQLEKTIAAMANTLGGLVLIGVEEDELGKPKVPMVGLGLERGLSERVTNIVLSNVTPPVFPEIAVCPNDGNDRVVLVVRVPQSHLSPHAIQQNTSVYIRTGNRNSPERLASLDDLAWLQDRRQRSVRLREHLFDAAVKRSDLVFGFLAADRVSSFRPVETQPTNLILRAVPEFPSPELVSPPELQRLYQQLRVRDYYGTDYNFPLGNANATILQNGICTSVVLDSDKGKRHYYAEFSVFGQFFYRQTLTANFDGRVIIRASEIFARVDQFLDTSRNFFDKLGYRGAVRMLCSVYGAHTSALGQWGPSEMGLPISTCPDITIGHETTFLAADWAIASRQALIQGIRTVGWAYDWDIPEALLDSYYAKHKRT